MNSQTTPILPQDAASRDHECPTDLAAAFTGTADGKQDALHQLEDSIEKAARADDPASYIDQVVGLAATLNEPAERRRIVRTMARELKLRKTERVALAKRIHQVRAAQYDDLPGRDERGDNRYAIHRRTLGEWRVAKQGKGGDAIATEEWHELGSFWAKITGIVKKDGAAQFIISGANGYGPFEIQVDAHKYGGHYLCAALEAVEGNIIYPRCKEHIGPAIKEVSDMDLAEHLLHVSQTGWRVHDGAPIFLIPGALPPDIQLNLPQKLCYLLNADTELTLGLEVLDKLADWLGETALVLVVYVLVAPAAEPLNLASECFALSLEGESGNFKTSAGQVAMCMYGPGFLEDANLIKLGSDFGSTPRAISKMLQRVASLPALLDNNKTQTQSPEKLVGLLHTLLEGGERDRLTSRGELIEGSPLYCWPILTGEDFITSSHSTGLDGATVARVVRVAFDGMNQRSTDLLTEIQDGTPHLCAVGRAWIEWLAGEGKAFAGQQSARFVRRRAAIFRTLRANHPGGANLHRHASNLAVLATVLQLALRHPTIGRVLHRHLVTWRTVLHNLTQSQAVRASDAQYGQRFCELLRDRVDAGKFIVAASAEDYCRLRNSNTTLTTNFQVVGWRGREAELEVIYLLPGLAVTPLRREFDNLSAPALYKALDRIGAVARKGSKDSTVSVRFGSGKQDVARVLALRAASLDHAPDQDARYVDTSSLRG